MRNTTLEFFTEKLNGYEASVENIQESLKKLRTVGSEAGVVKDQVDSLKVPIFIKNLLQSYCIQYRRHDKQKFSLRCVSVIERKAI